LALAGCYSFPTMGRARTVPARRVELWGAPEVYVVATPAVEGREAGASSRPLAEGGLRYGASDAVELDAHVGTFGVSAGAKLQLERSADAQGGVDIAFAPALELTLPDKPAIELPVLVGWNFHGGHQLVASLRVVYQQHWGVGGQADPVSFAYAGGSIGFAWQITRRLALFPEIAALTQIYAQPGFTSSLPDAIGLEAGVGVLFDP
ncbi:MAG TPA: hypothetical protein VLX92_23865, partial [Kofleriaceae bacterium]|nr:hypothetical protein [Kofleriaceae bacterium]